MRGSRFALALIVVGACAAPAHAQTSQAGSCDGVQWKDARIAKSCTAVVERNGKKYVQMSGKVIRKNRESITVLLDHSREELTWMPDLGETVLIDGRETPPASVVIGQQLRFYLPEAQVTTR